MKTARAYIFLAVLASMAAACATTADPDRRRVRSEVITREEIMEVDVGNLYEVVHRLRPQWLREDRLASDRSGYGAAEGVVVYQDQSSYLGGVEVLRQWGRSSALELRWMEGGRASSTLPGLGSRNVAGAIIIVTRQPR